MIIDTTECPIATTLGAAYSGYKKKHTFKYELGIAIGTGKFVWAPTPGLLGPNADQDSFRYFGIATVFQPWELFLGDGHYVGLPHCFFPTIASMTKRDRKIRSYIEHAIGRLKKWSCLETPWRHKYEIHYVVFGVCVHITNMMLDEQPLFHLPHHSLWEFEKD